MHPLWISSFLSLIICSTSESTSLNSMAEESSATNDTSGCNSVPYPFGTPGNALKGFEVVCTSSTSADQNRNKLLPDNNGTHKPNPSLQLPSGTYLIQNISLLGEVSISTGPIYHYCYKNGSEKLKRGSGWLNLTGTPFTLSKNYTTFVAIGCDDVVLIESIDVVGNRSHEKSGCVAYCTNSSNTIDGSCSGLGCCQMPLPGPGGIKSFDLVLAKIQDGVNQIDDCSVGFFASRDEFSFEAVNSEEYYKASATDYVVVLDWVIGEKSCEETLNPCNEHSHCNNSLKGMGYTCTCNQGYEGNPYAQGGCTDVDECQNPNSCIHKGLCVNTQGSYTCNCPSDMVGDGRIDGSGCKKTFPVNVILGICLLLVFILALASFYSYSRLQKRKLINIRSEFFRQNGGWILQQRLASQGIDSTTSRIFSEEELLKATDNYSENRIVGRGGYGTVYKGVLSNQQVVAIKRSKLLDGSQVEQFINEISILSQINHRNVVRILGCCLETQVPLLVYEFISNGTLSEHIHCQNSLPWEDRLRISRETAHAIAYLHSAASFPIIHRDIKASNILLDGTYNAKVSDFGASRSVPFDQTHVTTLVQGTLGYLDPEYFHTSLLTDKSDVYSFGVVLAELLTGQLPVSYDRPENHRNLATYFILLFDEDQLIKAIEPRLLAQAKLDELHFVAHLARRCLNVKGEDRPTMKEVAMELEGLTKTVQKRFHGEIIQGKEQLIEEIGSTSSISEFSEVSRQYSLECQSLPNMGYPR